MTLWFSLLAIFAFGIAAEGQPPGGMGRPPFGMGPGRRPSPSGNPGTNQPAGKWWTNPAVVRRLSLSDDQQKRIEQTFQQTRLRLIDLQASLEKQEALLDPLLAEDRPQETLVVAQIDRVASARAELEKASARMLFAFRLVLTQEQWKELQASGERSPGRPPGRLPEMPPGRRPW